MNSNNYYHYIKYTSYGDITNTSNLYFKLWIQKTGLSSNFQVCGCKKIITDQAITN